MKISLQHIQKKFNNIKILDDINLEIEQHQICVILGANGSGKSTLMQIISGKMLQTDGNIFYAINSQNITSENVFSQISYAAPYIDIIDEFTASELLQFHFKFKKLQCFASVVDLLEYLKLPNNKNIKYFSSGMKMKLKLGMAFYSESSLLLLDEPCSHFDTINKHWYKNELTKIQGKRTIIIASNDTEEYDFIENRKEFLIP